ncbi:MAG: ABC transporter permease [Candidatus Sumerlaeaceae bacterium]
MRFFRTYARQLVLLLVLAVQVIVLGKLSPYFLDTTNLLELSTHLAEAGLIACGMTLVIMTGGIDLSVGSLLGLSGIVLGYTWKPLGPAGAVLAAFTTGLIGGMLNGALVVAGKLPPLVVTLGTMALFRGIAMVISKAQPVSDFPDTFAWWGQGAFAVGGIDIPVQLAIWVALMLIFVMVVDRTVVGRYLTAIGDNELAARYAALPANRVKFAAYLSTGLLSAFAAIIFTSRVSTAKADAGQNLELEVITAVVLGGTAITGGRGTVLGSFLGVLILGLLRNGLSLAGVPSVYQTISAGVLLISVSILNERMLERASRRKPRASAVLQPA